MPDTEIIDAIINEPRHETRTLAPLVLPKTQVLLNRIAEDLEDARGLVIDSPTMAAMATEMAGRFSTVMAEMDAERKAGTVEVRTAIDWWNNGFAQAINTVRFEFDQLKLKLVGWNRLERARIDSERQAQENARRQAAAQAAAAEAEALARAAQAAQEAQAAQAAGSEQVAAALIGSAQVAVDEARQNAAVAAQAVFTPIATVAPVVKGSSQRVKWKGRVTNKATLIAHIASTIANGDLSLLGLIDVSDSAINTMANLQRENMNIPGIEAYPEDRVSIRKKAV